MTTCDRVPHFALDTLGAAFGRSRNFSLRTTP
jgi:hypothetical protein